MNIIYEEKLYDSFIRTIYIHKALQLSAKNDNNQNGAF